VAVVPGAPQSVSASASSSTTANVSWSAPASNGGATITSYSIYWSGGSTTSGTTSVGIGGLSPTTSYTFTVYATNSAGTGPGTASNTITTPVARGCSTYTTAGTYTFTVPAGVTSISIAAVGTGGSGSNFKANNQGGAGGSTVVYNNYSVSPGQTYTVCISRCETISFTDRIKSSYFWFTGSYCSPGYYIRGTGGAPGCQSGYCFNPAANLGAGATLANIMWGTGGNSTSSANYGNGGGGAGGIGGANEGVTGVEADGSAGVGTGDDEGQ
jgi:hypothetical protein